MQDLHTMKKKKSWGVIEGLVHHQPKAKPQFLFSNSPPYTQSPEQSKTQTLWSVPMQFPKQLWARLSSVFAFWIHSAASLRPAWSSSFRKSCTHTSFFYNTLISKFQVASFTSFILDLLCYQRPCKIDSYLSHQFGSNSDANISMYECDTSWIHSYMLQCSWRQF